VGGPSRAAQEHLLQGRRLRLEEDDQQEERLQHRLQDNHQCGGLASRQSPMQGLALNINGKPSHNIAAMMGEL